MKAIRESAIARLSDAPIPWSKMATTPVSGRPSAAPSSALVPNDRPCSHSARPRQPPADPPRLARRSRPRRARPRRARALPSRPSRPLRPSSPPRRRDERERPPVPACASSTTSSSAVVFTFALSACATPRGTALLHALARRMHPRTPAERTAARVGDEAAVRRRARGARARSLAGGVTADTGRASLARVRLRAFGRVSRARVLDFLPFVGEEVSRAFVNLPRLLDAEAGANREPVGVFAGRGPAPCDSRLLRGAARCACRYPATKRSLSRSESGSTCARSRGRCAPDARAPSSARAAELELLRASRALDAVDRDELLDGRLRDLFERAETEPVHGSWPALRRCRRSRGARPGPRPPSA